MNFAKLSVLAAAAALAGCAMTSNISGPVQSLPHTAVTKTEVRKPAPQARQTPLWIEPTAAQSLNDMARERLAGGGFRLAAAPGEAKASVRLDGAFLYLSGDRRKMANLRLENWHERERLGVMLAGATADRGLARRSIDRVGDQALAGNIASPAHLAASAAMAVAAEGTLGAMGLRGGAKPSPDDAPALVCTPESPCSVEDAVKRYGVQRVVLHLDWQDASGKHRSTVEVDGIGPDLMPDRMLAEAADRLLSLYVAP